MGCAGGKQVQPRSSGDSQTVDTNKEKEDLKNEDDTSHQEGGDSNVIFTDYELNCLARHNECRNKHGGPVMALNRELCDMAQHYAEYLIRNDLFQHSEKDDRKYNARYVGENLGCYWGSGYEEYDATQNWYEELKDYDFDSPGFSLGTGHFTQVVWKKSAELGVGRAIDLGSKKVVVVGRYYPGGNVTGSFPENVTAPC